MATSEPTAWQNARDAVFESLWYLQKNTFYNKTYIANIMWSATFSLAIAVHSNFQWSHDLQWLQDFFYVLSVPTQSLSSTSVAVCFALAAVTVTATAGLLAWVSYSLAHGRFPAAWVAKTLRALLGVVATFGPVFARTLAVYITCDFIEADSVVAPSHFWGFKCAESPGYVALFVLSCVMLVLLLVLSLLSALMHENHPKSHSLLARSHSRIDMGAYTADLVLSLLFDVVADSKRGALAGLYLVTHTSLLVAQLLLQPFFHHSMNNLRAATMAVLVWTGVCLVLVTAAPDAARVWSIGYAAGFIPSLVGGWLACHAIRNIIIGRTLAKYGVSWSVWRGCVTEVAGVGVMGGKGKKKRKQRAKGKGKVHPGDAYSFGMDGVDSGSEDVDVRSGRRRGVPGSKVQSVAADALNTAASGWREVAGKNGSLRLPELRYGGDGTVTIPPFSHHQLLAMMDAAVDDDHDILGKRPTTLVEDVAAHMVDTALRFLERYKSPHFLDIAEDVLKRGIAAHPTSSFLRLRLASFLNTYRTSRVGAYLWLDRTMAQPSVATDWHFSTYRFKKMFARLDEHAELGQDTLKHMDTIAFEDLKKKLKKGLTLTKAATRMQYTFWKLLYDDLRVTHRTMHARGRGGADGDGGPAQLSERTMQTLDALGHVDKQAEEAFEAVLKLAAESPIVLEAYASFLLLVRQDERGHRALMARVQQPDRTSPTKPGAAGSVSGVQALASTSDKKLLAELTPLAAQEEAASKRLWRLTLVGSCVLAGLLTVLLVLFLHTQSQYETTLANINESGRARTLSQFGLMMGRYCHMGGAFNIPYLFSICTIYTESMGEDLRASMQRLTEEYPTEYQPLLEYYSKPVVPTIEVSSIGTRTTVMLDPTEFTQRFVSAMIAVSQSSPTDYPMVFHQPGSFPEYLFVIANTQQAGIVLDHIGALYTEEARELTDTLSLYLVAFCSAALVVEILMVVLLFRPALSAVLSRRTASQKRLLSMDSLVVMSLRNSAKSALKAAAEAADKQGCCEQEEADDTPRTGGDAAFTETMDFEAEREDPAGSDSETSPRPAFDDSGPSPAMARSTPTRANTFAKGAPVLRTLSLTQQLPPTPPVSDDSSESVDSEGSADVTASGKRGGARSPAGDNRNGRPRPPLAKADSWSTVVGTKLSKPKRDAEAVRFVYRISLLITTAALCTLAVLGLVNVGRAAQSAGLINAAARVRYLGFRVNTLMRELSMHPFVALVGSPVEALDTVDKVRSQMTQANREFAAVYTSMLFGVDAGLVDLPEANGWPAFGSDSPFSSLTSNPGLWRRSMDVVAGVDAVPKVKDVLFKPWCFGILPFSSSSPVMTEERMKIWTDQYDGESCPGFEGGDVVMSNGLHSCMLSFFLHYNNLDEVTALVSTSHPDIVAVMSRTSYELYNGLGLPALVFAEDAMNQLQYNRTLMLVAFVACLAVLVVQHMWFGRHVRAMSTTNHVQHQLVDRLVSHGVKKKGKRRSGEGMPSRRGSVAVARRGMDTPL